MDFRQIHEITLNALLFAAPMAGALILMVVRELLKLRAHDRPPRTAHESARARVEPDATFRTSGAQPRTWSMRSAGARPTHEPPTRARPSLQPTRVLTDARDHGVRRPRATGRVEP